MWFLPLSAPWCGEGTWDIQFARVSKKKIRRTERFYFVIRFEILYKEADVDCFKHPDGAEEWGCFLTANRRTCEKAVVEADYLRAMCTTRMSAV